MKIICIGRNYKAHALELGNEPPTEPIIFIKPDTAVHNLEQPYYIPDFSNEIHYETEIIIKISKQGKYISEKFANKYYEEIGLGIDFTARDIQTKLKEKGLPWEMAKAFDGSAVVGTFFQKEIFDNEQNINFHLSKNNQIIQKGNTSQMIWTIPSLIAYVSQFFTLRKGDLLFTGTPAGTGKILPNSTLEGFIEDKKAFSLFVK
ncbi:MAG: fumarylacetoacetate hydrolase family protein [Capnocytophaga sp.]|nr:fumarylacetoacetate hydrolase family protein [Capnocytophaga sp.]